MIDFDIQKVMEYLPHRYPFLLIDRVTACSPGEHLKALKNVTINEPFFQGHFPGQPIMPGVLILEALAQATGLLSFCTMEADHKKKLYMLVGIDKARFRGQVVPPCRVYFVSVVGKRSGNRILLYPAQAFVEGKMVMQMELMGVLL